MLLRPFYRLGLAVNRMIHGLGAPGQEQALRAAALLLGAIWAVFLPLLLLLWFVVMARHDLPYGATVASMADSLLFVVACFLGVRLHLGLKPGWLSGLSLALVVALFLPLLTIVASHSLPLQSALSLELLRFYYGWAFDVYVFCLLGLLAGLNSYRPDDLPPAAG